MQIKILVYANKFARLHNTGKKKYYLVVYPNGVRDVYYAWVSSLGKTVPQNEVMTRTVKLTNVGKPLLAEYNEAGD
jgi:putative tail component of prophage|nr:MAG TPA: tail tube protein [Caudoviricetes sp.]